MHHFVEEGVKSKRRNKISTLKSTAAQQILMFGVGSPSPNAFPLSKLLYIDIYALQSTIAQLSLALDVEEHRARNSLI